MFLVKPIHAGQQPVPVIRGGGAAQPANIAAMRSQEEM